MKPVLEFKDGISEVEADKWKEEFVLEFRIILEVYKFTLNVNKMVNPETFTAERIYQEFESVFVSYEKALESIDSQIKYMACTCPNGTPLTSNTDIDGKPESKTCQIGNSIKCETCDHGYHVNGKITLGNSCRLNKCSCENGEEATGTQCPTNGATKCTSCNSGNQLIGTTCSGKECNCQNGRGATGTSCPANGDWSCASCYLGYHVNGRRYCNQNECKCTSGRAGGTGTTGTSCPAHDAHKCESCIWSGDYVRNGICTHRVHLNEVGSVLCFLTRMNSQLACVRRSYAVNGYNNRRTSKSGMSRVESSYGLDVGPGVKITVFGDKDYRGCKQSFSNCEGTKAIRVKLNSCVKGDVDSFKISVC